MTLPERLVQTFAERHPTDAAALLEEQSADDAADVLARLPEEVGARVLGSVASSIASAALARLDRPQALALLARLPLERAAAVLRPLDRETREDLIATLPNAERVRALVTYPPGTAGGLMDPSVPALPADLDLEEVRRRLGELLGHLALELYVVDAEQRPIGVAELRDVLDTSRRGALSTISEPADPVSERADLPALGAHPGWLRYGTIPVVDDHGRFVGALRAERLRQVAQEAVTRRSRGGSEAVSALGELFWLGLTGLFSSMARSRAEEGA